MNSSGPQSSKLTTVLDKYRGVVIGAAVVCVLVAGYVVYRTFAGMRRGPINSVYFTADNGQTWFSGPVNTITPYTKNGKEVDRMHVFECDGKIVPGYVERYTASAKEQLERAQGDEQAMRRLTLLRTNGTEVRKPGESEWHPKASSEGTSIRAVPCSPDAKSAEELFP